MPFKLKELDRFLCRGKMHFECRNESRHIGYLVRLGGQRLGLPTLLRISHGNGDADFGNVKGIACALGLNVRELESAEACFLRRECVLLALATHMLNFAVQRRAFLRDSASGLEGVQAMAESVRVIVQLPEFIAIPSWKPEELKVFHRIRPTIQGLASDSLLAETAEMILAHMNRG